MLHKFLEEADMEELLKLAALIGGAVLLLYLMGNLPLRAEEDGDHRDEDEEALVAGQLPAAARRQLLILTLPLVPRALLELGLPPSHLPLWLQARQGQAGTSTVTRRYIPSPQPLCACQRWND
jgi:hypothetical protein